jgi:hypothetical protein
MRMLLREPTQNILKSLLYIEAINQETNIYKGGSFVVENMLPQYEPPTIRTYTEEEILEELGPARTCTSGDQGHGNCPPRHRYP